MYTDSQHGTLKRMVSWLSLAPPNRRRFQNLSLDGCRSELGQQVRTAELMGTNCESLVRAAGVLLNYLGRYRYQLMSELWTVLRSVFDQLQIFFRRLRLRLWLRLQLL